MRCEFFQDIYFEYCVIFRASWLKHCSTLPKVIWHRLFLLNVSVVFVNAEKCSVQNRVVFIKP